jgi:nitrogen fixation NifU-like protein
MPILMTSAMMRQIIMDHYSNPQNKHQPPKEGYEKVHMHSDNCIDDLDIFLLVKDGKIIDACFDGVACTISTSSTDIMCDLLKDKDIEEGRNIIEQFQHMIHEEKFDEGVLEEAIVFINTSKQAARIRCATIGWNAADEILKDK